MDHVLLLSCMCNVSVVINNNDILFAGITLFKYSQLQEIVMRVIKNASIHGFLSAHSGCAFETIGMIKIVFMPLYSYMNLHNDHGVALYPGSPSLV